MLVIFQGNIRVFVRVRPINNKEKPHEPEGHALMASMTFPFGSISKLGWRACAFSQCLFSAGFRVLQGEPTINFKDDFNIGCRVGNIGKMLETSCLISEVTDFVGWFVWKPIICETPSGVYDGQHSRRKFFDFDQVFPPSTPQTQVFEEAKPLATSTLDGYLVGIGVFQAF